MKGLFLAVLLAVGGCAGSLIHGRVADDVQVRMNGHGYLETEEDEFQVICQGNPGDTLVLYFLRNGYYPQIKHVKIPEGKLQQAPGPWKKLPDDKQGVLAGVVCTYAAGGRHVHVFYFEEFKRNHTMTIELNGDPTEITTDEKGAFMLFMPPGKYEVKVAWAPRLFGDSTGSIEIEPAATTLLDICKLTTLVD